MMTRFVNMNMKRTAAVLLCGAALALPALAQSDSNGAPPPPPSGQQGPPPGGGGRRGGGPEQRPAMLQSQLNLTPDQTEKVKAIMADGRTQMMALRQDQSMSQEDKQAKMMSMRKTENDKVKAILTSDQKVKFEALEKQQREQMRDRRDGGGSTPPPPAPAPPTPPQN